MNNSGNGRGGGGIVREAGEIEAEPTEEAQEEEAARRGG